MTSALMDLLSGLKKERQKPSSGDYVFVNAVGRPWRNNLLTRFKRCVREAGINPRGVDIHCLRYTFGTHLIRQGANAKVVQKLMGHATVAMTLNIYAQVFPSDLSESIKRLPFCYESAPGIGGGPAQRTASAQQIA